MGCPDRDQSPSPAGTPQGDCGKPCLEGVCTFTQARLSSMNIVRLLTGCGKWEGVQRQEGKKIRCEKVENGRRGIRLLCRCWGRSGRGPLETAIHHGERMWELVCWLLCFFFSFFFFCKKKKFGHWWRHCCPKVPLSAWVLPARFLAFFSQQLFFLMFTWPKEMRRLLHLWCFRNGISSELVSVIHCVMFHWMSVMFWCRNKPLWVLCCVCFFF